MPLVNHAKQEINAKIVYFGPAASGKGTNLHNIFKKLKKDCRGKMKTMNLQNERMLFFDFVPPGQNASEGYQVRFHIYTLLGKVSAPSSWKMLLKGVDGIVFVADSDPSKMPDNLQSLNLLQTFLKSQEAEKRTPLILQYNKRDAEHPVPIEEMDRQLNIESTVSVPAVAIRSDGVLDSLSRLIRTIMNDLTEFTGEEEAGSSQGMASAVPAPGEVPPAATALSPAPSASLKLGEVHTSGRTVTIPLMIAVDGTEKRLAIAITLDEV